MPRRIAKTDTSQPEIISAFKAAGCVVVNTAGLGDGFPDLVAIFPDGRAVLLIECKTPGNVKFTEPELRFMLNIVPPSYRIVLSAEQVMDVIQEMNK